MTWRDEGYIEALQQETIILAKRVMAARSRLQLTTCFDTSPSSILHPSILEGGEPTMEEEEVEDEVVKEFLNLPARLCFSSDEVEGVGEDVQGDVREGDCYDGDVTGEVKGEGAGVGECGRPPVILTPPERNGGSVKGSGGGGERMVKRTDDLEDWKRLKESLLL